MPSFFYFGTCFANIYCRRRNVEVQFRILLAEDDAPLRRSLKKFLTNAGYSLCTCSNAREALVAAEDFRPDIVICEYHLPDANGAMLIKRLLAVTHDVVAVLISEFDFELIADEVAQSNVHGFLKKPFDLAELETVLMSACCQVRISMCNLMWNSVPVATVYLPPTPRGKLSERMDRYPVGNRSQVRVTNDRVI